MLSGCACRLGSYEISEAEGVDDSGTKIVIHLKGDCYDFSKEENIRGNGIEMSSAFLWNAASIPCKWELFLAWNLLTKSPGVDYVVTDSVLRWF